MRYIAILGYDCGCVPDANYGFIRGIRFSAKDNKGLERRVHKLKQRVPQKGDGFQCKKSLPIGVLVFDGLFKLVKKWNKGQEREV